jgi:hypothetical protein
MRDQEGGHGDGPAERDRPTPRVYRHRPRLLGRAEQRRGRWSTALLVAVVQRTDRRARP